MKGSPKTKDQLLEELEDARRRIAELEASGSAETDLKKDSPDMDADFLDLGAIMDLPAVHSLLNDFYKLTDMALAILDLRGKVLIAIGWQDICTKFHRIHPQTALNCTESDLFLAKNVRQGEYVAYKCKNRLWDLVTPLYIGGRHAGNIYTGQFFYDDEVIDEDVFAEQAVQYGFDREAYLSALHRVPRFSREKVNDIMNFVSKFAVMVSELSYSNLKLARSMADLQRISEALRESEARLRTLVQTIPDLVWLKDVDGVYLCCNPPFERFFGAREVDILGKTDYEFTDKNQAEFFREHDRKALEAGKPRSNEEWLTFRDNGYHGLFDTIKTPMYDAAGGLIGVLGISRDITERKRAEESLRKAEEKLRQSYKMEALGTLAGGIAHTFNNILASVLGHAELAKMGIGNRETTDGLLDEIIHATLRARDLVRQILTFTQQAGIKREPMDMVPVIQETLKFLRASLPAAIHMQQEIPDSGTTVVADPTQIRQIIMNLCANAAYAMKEKGGVLDVRLAEVTMENGADPALKELPPGRYLRLVVSDTGCGIAGEIIQKIFDPFFTTKQRGEASGMGLSVVHGIVKDMGGTILVQSDPGKGSAFHIFFPKYEGEFADASRGCR